MIDLKPFCAEPGATIPRGFPLDKPWVYDGHEYASNGHILMRVPTKKKANGKHPKAIIAMFAAKGKPRWTGWPWSMVVRHSTQDGVGWEYAVDISHRLIDLKYDRLIRTLSDVEFDDRGGSSDPLAFRFKGGKGFVMGIDYEC